ncbi:universal stress protein PHOS34-like [Wolffia australiana]
MASSTSAEEKQVIVVGIDEGEHSEYALQWTLDHFFTGRIPIFSLVVVYARPFPTSVIGIGSPGMADVLPFVESNLRTIAASVVERTKKLCESKSAGDAVIKMIEGDARDVLCEAVKKHKAALLVVGSHGYGPIKRTFLGSVSDHCAHHADCTVMVVKKPQQSK